MTYHYNENDKFYKDGEEYYIAAIDESDEEYPYECYPVRLRKAVKTMNPFDRSPETQRIIDQRLCMSDYDILLAKSKRLEVKYGKGTLIAEIDEERNGINIIVNVGDQHHDIGIAGYGYEDVEREAFECAMEGEGNDVYTSVVLSMYDVEEERFRDYDALVIEGRVNKASLPHGIFAYEIRDDGNGEACSIEEHVTANFWGTILTNSKLFLPRMENGHKYMTLDRENEDGNTIEGDASIDYGDAEEITNVFEFFYGCSYYVARSGNPDDEKMCVYRYTDEEGNKFWHDVVKALAMSDCTDERVEKIVFCDEEVEYVGWQPDMLYEFKNGKGEIVFSACFPEFEH